MIHNLGLPYMGSKRKLAGKIVGKILKDNPKSKYFYDLFGGGGAISVIALQMPQIEQVIYNELNTGVVALLRDLQANRMTEKYYQWISRETFFTNKDKDTWLGGLCKVVWSFGNKQTEYMFGKEVESVKHLAHKAIIQQDAQALEQLGKVLGITIPASLLLQDNSLFGDTIQQRRLRIMRYIKQRQEDRFELQQLEQLQQLERLQQLHSFQNLIIKNKDYRDVVIDTPEEETIIYLDPPYKNTRKYQENINHEALFNWIKESPYKVYVSSYHIGGLKCIEEWEHDCSLSATATNKVTEKLYRNII